MKKFIIYKDYDPQQEGECMRCLIGDREQYEERKNYINEASLEIYNDNGEELKTDQDYEYFMNDVSGQLKLKCNFKR